MSLFYIISGAQAVTVWSLIPGCSWAAKSGEADWLLRCGFRSKHRVLVYAFMPNKTLDDHLFNWAYPPLREAWISTMKEYEKLSFISRPELCMIWISELYRAKNALQSRHVEYILWNFKMKKKPCTQTFSAECACKFFKECRDCN